MNENRVNELKRVGARQIPIEELRCHPLNSNVMPEDLRAKLAEVEGRALVDLVIDVIKAEVKDDAMRDRIARAIFERAPSVIEAEALRDIAIACAAADQGIG